MDFAHQAKAAGDHENGLKWAQQHEAQLKARHERHEKRMRLFIDLVKVSPVLAAVLLALMVLTNVFLFIDTHRFSDLAWSFVFAAHTVKLGIEIASGWRWLAAVVACFGGPDRAARGGPPRRRARARSGQRRPSRTPTSTWRSTRPTIIAGAADSCAVPADHRLPQSSACRCSTLVP